MKVYTVILNGERVNDYIRGRISGMAYVLTGMPERTYSWRKLENCNHWYMDIECTEVQYLAVVEVIENVYPGVILQEE